MFSGCLQVGGPAEILDWIGSPRGFSATYEGEIGVVEVTLARQDSVADRDLTTRSAFRVDVNRTIADGAWAGETLWYRYYLDADLRVARIDRPCWVGPVSQPCERGYAVWMDQGSLPPLGLGLPGLFVDGTLSHQLGGRDVQVAARLTSDRDGVAVVVDDDAEVVTSIEHPFHNLRGTWRYADMLPMPSSAQFDFKDDRVQLIRTEFNWTEPLGAVDRWPMEPISPGDPSMDKPILFPGSDHRPFDRDVSHADALQALLEDQPQLEGFLQEGCLRRYGVYFQEGGHEFQPSVPVVSQELATESTIFFTFSILYDEGHSNQIWRVYRVNATPENYWTFHREDLQEKAEPGGCQVWRESGPPVVPFDRFLAQIDSLPLAHAESYVGMSLSNADWYRLPGNEYKRSLGTGLYVASMEPKELNENNSVAGGAGVMMLGIQYYAAHGWFQQFVLHPEDIAAIDRGERV